MTAPMLSAGATLDSIAFAAFGVVLKVTLLIAVAGMLALVLRRASAAARHQVWMLATFSSLLVPLLAIVPGPLVRIPASWLPVAQSELQSLVQSRKAPAAVRQTAPTQSTKQRPETLRVWTPSARRAPMPIGVRPSALMNSNIEDLLPQRPLRNRTMTLNDGRGTVVEFDARISPERQAFIRHRAVVPTVAPPPDDAINPTVVVAILWGIGALALLGWRALGYMLLARIVRQSAPVADTTWHTSLRQCCAESGVVRPVRLLSHRSFSTPVTAGWSRPVILLPVDIRSTTPERQQAVLAHELAHIRRSDFLTQGIAAIATSVFWFHPLVWLAAARMRAESECAADDSVLVRGLEAERYARHLLALACRTTTTAGYAMPAVGMARITQLEQRLRAILNARASRNELTRRAQQWIAGASLVVVAPYASLRFSPDVTPLNPALVPTPAVERTGLEQRRKQQDATQPAAVRAATVRNDSTPAADAHETLWTASVVIAKQTAAMKDTAPRQETSGAPFSRTSDEVILRRAAIDSVARAAWLPVVAGDTVIEQSTPMRDGELLTLSVNSGANLVVRGWDQPFAKLRATLGGPAWRQADAQMVRGKEGIWVGSASERDGYKIMRSPGATGYGYARIADGRPWPEPTSVDHLLEVWVPRRTNIKFHSSLGAVSIHDVEGEVNGGAQTGSIHINNVKGRAAVDTKLGDIHVSNSVLNGSANTGCGTVITSGVTGSFSAVSQLDPAPYQAQGLSTPIMIVDGIRLGDYCDPRLRRFAALPNRAIENNPYGDIVLDSAPNGGTLSTGRRGSIVVRASGGHLSASTNQGNIDLSNVKGDATARARRGDITIRLVNTPDAVHNVHAQTANGNVIIEIPDSLDARIEAGIVTTDSFSAKGRFSHIVDQFGLSAGATLPRSGSSRGDGALSAAIGMSLGRGTGRISIHVTDGDIIFKRVKR